MYKVVFSELAVNDIKDTVAYISHELNNPSSAEKLTDRFIAAPESIQEFPYYHQVYIPIKPLEHEYRRLYVDNYIMYYLVDETDKTISIERLIYSGRLTDAL